MGYYTLFRYKMVYHAEEKAEIQTIGTAQIGSGTFFPDLLKHINYVIFSQAFRKKHEKDKRSLSAYFFGNFIALCLARLPARLHKSGVKF